MRRQRSTGVERWALGLFAVVLGGCAWLEGDDYGGETSTSSGSSSTTEWVCTTECNPGVCQTLACEGEVCKHEELPAGTMVDESYGDCRALVCDGVGGFEEVIADDPPHEPRGNCSKSVCDAAGNPGLVVDPSDAPNDGLECTFDACVDGAPTSTPMAINSPCAGGGYCDALGTCRACPIHDPCVDDGPEPNNNQGSATQLGNITDKDSDGGRVCAVLGSASDIDWYVYGGTDVAFSAVDPTRTLTATANARLCVYAHCASGGTSVGCTLDTPDTSPGGDKGCCGFGTVSPNINCDGLDDSATIWIKVEPAGGPACMDYQLDYHF